MDNGEEIPGLNEDWNFMGANMMELCAGLAMFFVSGEGLFQSNYGGNMPYLIGIWIGTTLGLARLRRRFPDENRGVKNYFLTTLGFAPPGIPTPASLQSSWSGAPLRDIKTDLLKKDCEFLSLGLDKVFASNETTKNDDL